MFTTGTELLELCKSQNISISEAVILSECEEFQRTPEEIREELHHYIQVMRDSCEAAKEHSLKTMGGLISGDTSKLNRYAALGDSLCGETVLDAMVMASSCAELNASMGRICAAPTAGACGILPAALFATQKKFGFSEDKIYDGILTASAIGLIIASVSTLSGAEGGCQAECGTGAAMAAAAICQMRGSDMETILHAAAISLKNIMGLICDPVAGLVESPCAKRNISGVVNGMLSADLAMSGVKSVIPFDQVVYAMYKVGRMLPSELRETANGGIAATKAGLEKAEEIYG